MHAFIAINYCPIAKTINEKETSPLLTLARKRLRKLYVLVSGSFKTLTGIEGRKKGASEGVKVSVLPTLGKCHFLSKKEALKEKGVTSHTAGKVTISSTKPFLFA